MATKPWKLFEFENGQILAGLTYGDEESSVALTSTLKYDENDCTETKTFIFDLAGGLNLDVWQAVGEKLYYNQHRDDHKPENRLKKGGKAF